MGPALADEVLVVWYHERLHDVDYFNVDADHEDKYDTAFVVEEVRLC